MRVLFTCLPAEGHFHPLLPLAEALAAAGHEVAFASADEIRPHMAKTGFPTFAAGLGMVAQMDEARRRYPGFHPRQLWESDDLEFTLTRIWAAIGAASRLPDLLAVVESWRPDLVVHENREFAGPVAAAAAGIPYVNHSVGTLLPLDLYRRVGDALAPLWEGVGVDPGPLGGLFRYLLLDVFPPTLRGDEVAELGVVQGMRAVSVDTLVDHRLPAWLDRLPDRPTVYVTRGTTFNQDPGLFATVVEALSREPVNVVVTVGLNNDPAALGPQPDNVHVERYVPQSLLFAHCDVVVSHSGGGTTLTALAHGLPMLALPQAGDQFLIGRRLASCGAARVLLDRSPEPEVVRREVRTLLDDPGYRRSAERLRDEIRAMPGPEVAVSLLERLARERRPLSAARPPGPPPASAASEPA